MSNNTIIINDIDIENNTITDTENDIENNTYIENNNIIIDNLINTIGSDNYNIVKNIITDIYLKKINNLTKIINEKIEFENRIKLKLKILQFENDNLKIQNENLSNKLNKKCIIS